MEKSKEYLAKGASFSDPNDIASREEYLEHLSSEIKTIKAKIKELEDAKQIAVDTAIEDTIETETVETTTDAITTAADTTATTTGTTSTAADTTTTSANDYSEIIILKGAVQDVANSLTLEINLITGVVNGTVDYNQSQNLEGTSMTSSYTGSLKGSIDLSTLKINGTGSGDIIITR